MIEIILFTFISNVFFYSYGNLIKFENFSNKIKNINDRSIIGCIIISFLALVANFFIPLAPSFNSFFLIVGVFIFLVFRFKKFTKKEFVYLILSSLISSSLLIYSNINRPDAGLYHLPYINILNEYKIIFGLNNIHFRFGTISIIQYLSAINNNYFFKDLGILIPLASLVSFFIIYFFNNVLYILKNKKNISLENIFSLFILIFLAYKINRYSSFGNDAVAHLSFFYLISKMLSNTTNNLKFISLISIFAFLNKSMMIIALFIPVIIFLKDFKIKNFKLAYSFAGIFICFWLLKNIIITGCVVYPIKQTCLENLKWTDIEEVEIQNISGEAWSKDWPNRFDKSKTMEEYIKHFNWLDTWVNNHGKIFFKIIVPYLFVIISLSFLLKAKTNKTKKILFYENKYLKLLIFVSLIGTILFLIKFPLYRYGYSYLVSSIVLILIYFIKEYNYKNLLRISKFTFFICLIIFSGKQLVRYINNYNSDFIWPKIYSFENNEKIRTEKIILDEDFSVYLSNHLCMYNKAPCTNYKLKKLKVEKISTYYFLNLKKN